jgi:tetratricopeptide (TPR) repeat protein
VLDENQPAPAVVLWQTLRDVTLWAALPLEQRGPGLFNDEAADGGDAIPELRLDLATLGALLRDPHPDCAPIIASICQRIATWAEERERTGTALAFVQAAALVDRSSAVYAFGVAKFARQRADYARAMAWYRRAIVLARRVGDWKTQALAFAGLGNLHRQCGNLPQAVECHERSLRLARRFGLREVRGDALSDLSSLRYEMGDPKAGLDLARLALREYGPGHTRIPMLAHDTAVAWMDHHAAYGDALAMFRKLLAAHWRPADRVLLLSNLARAAGGIADRDLFDAVWVEVCTRVEDCRNREYHADALIGLARGALLLGDLARAEQAAERALSLARERKEGHAQFLAERVLAEVRGEQDRQPGTSASDAPDTESTAGRFISALRKCQRANDDATVFLLTALSFPGDAQTALQLARRARDDTECDRAAAWYRHAAALAQRNGEWEIHVRSLAGLANLHRQCGNLPAAMAAHDTALGAARRHGLRELEGDTLLDLCTLRFVMGEGDEGFSLAREALDAYGPGHAKTARVAHDVAVYLMNDRGDYANALMVFRELANHTWREADLLLLQGNTIKAAAGAGEMAVFEKAWEDARAMLRRSGREQENHAAALVNMAHGALTVGRTDWAETAASRAQEIAAARGEARNASLAAEMLGRVARAKATRARVRPFSSPGHDPRIAAVLSRELVSALRARAPRRSRSRTPTKD